MDELNTMLGLDRNSRLILVSQFLVGISYGLFFFILPVHIRSLGASPSQVGITLSAAGLSTLVVVLPFGYLADRHNPRTLMIITKVFAVIPIALLATASHWQVVMVLLFFTYFEGAVVTVFNSFLTRVVDTQDLQRTFSTIGFGYLFGELLFRAIGAWIAETAGMSLVFYLAAIMFALSIIPIALIRIHVNPKQSVKVDYRPLLRNRAFMGILAFSFAVVLLMEVGAILIPNYLSEAVGLEIASIGQLGSIAALGGAILTLTMGRIKGQGGLISVLASIILAMAMLVLSPTGMVLVGGMFLIGSIHAYYPIIEALMGRTVSAHLSGLAFGSIELMLGVALLVGPIIAGFLYEISPQMPLIFSIGGLLILVLATLILPWKSIIEQKELTDQPPSLS